MKTFRKYCAPFVLAALLIATALLAWRQGESARVPVIPPDCAAFTPVSQSGAQTVIDNSLSTTATLNASSVHTSQELGIHSTTNTQLNVTLAAPQTSKVLSLVGPAPTGARTPAMMVGIVTPGPGPAQGANSGQFKRFVARSGSKVRIEGTSNIREWQVEGTLIGGWLEAPVAFPSDVNMAKSARVNAFISVRSLKTVERDGSPYSDRMDEVMYDSMKVQTYGRIYYTLSSLTPAADPQAGAGCFSFDSAGTLAVAGVTNSIEMPVTITPLPDNQLRIKGSTTVKMTSFGIDPPSPKFLSALVKTDDEVKLSFEWTLAEKPGPLAMAK